MTDGQALSVLCCSPCRFGDAGYPIVVEVEGAQALERRETLNRGDVQAQKTRFVLKALLYPFTIKVLKLGAFTARISFSHRPYLNLDDLVVREIDRVELVLRERSVGSVSTRFSGTYEHQSLSRPQARSKRLYLCGVGSSRRGRRGTDDSWERVKGGCIPLPRGRKIAEQNSHSPAWRPGSRSQRSCYLLRGVAPLSHARTRNTATTEVKRFANERSEEPSTMGCRSNI